MLATAIVLAGALFAGAAIHQNYKSDAEPVVEDHRAHVDAYEAEVARE